MTKLLVAQESSMPPGTKELYLAGWCSLNLPLGLKCLSMSTSEMTWYAPEQKKICH